MKSLGIVLSLAASILFGSNVVAQETPVAATRTVNVGIFETDPFVMKDGNGGYTGFDIELWNAIAADLHFKTNFVHANSFPDLLDSVKNGKVDAALSSITVNSERHNVMDFSTPYFNSGLMIMVREGENKESVGSFVSTELPRSISSLGSYFPLFAVFTLASLFLVFGRSRWESFKSVPLTVLTAVLAFGAIFTGIMNASRLSAAMTADHFTYQVSLPRDLRGKPVATVAGTTSVPVLATYGASVNAVTDINDAYAMLTAGQVEAVVYDAPTLQYYAKTTGAGQVAAVGSVFAQQPYGIALPPNSDLRKQIDGAILRIKENGIYDRLYQNYFGE